MKLYLATWLEDNQGHTLSAIDAKRRLLSYYFIQESRLPEFVPNYITNGVYVRPEGMEKLPKPKIVEKVERIQRAPKVVENIEKENKIRDLGKIMSDLVFNMNMMIDALEDCKTAFDKLERTIKGELYEP